MKTAKKSSTPRDVALKSAQIAKISKPKNSDERDPVRKDILVVMVVEI